MKKEQNIPAHFLNFKKYVIPNAVQMRMDAYMREIK